MSTRSQFDLEVTAEFSAAHVLRGYAGACERVHGHNFEVVAHVRTESVDAVGMGIDFVELERLLRATLAPLDHRMLNELPAFADRNPTAEMIAQHVYRRLAAALADRPADAPPAHLRAVTVRENGRYRVRYREVATEAAFGRPPSTSTSGGHTPHATGAGHDAADEGM